MKAAQINFYGDTSVVAVTPDAPPPVPKPGQVLVAVRAASLNPFDGFLRSGNMKNRMPLPFPITVGGDFAGTISKLGDGVVGIAVGDEVFGTAHVANGGSGSMAELAAANAVNVAAKPQKSTFEEAAAIPLVGSSAVQALEENIHLQKGQKILIHGGAGGIGHIAVQLAKYMKAVVTTTVRTSDIEFVRSLGADEIIDFTEEDFSVKLKDFDAVYDTVGKEITAKSFSVIKKGGTLLSMKGPPDERLASEFGVHAIGQGTKTNTAHLTRVATLVDTGIIHVHIDKVFPLADVVAAWQHQEQNHTQGKVVVTV